MMKMVGNIFCCLHHLVIAGAWPVLIDEFVEHARPLIRGEK